MEVVAFQKPLTTGYSDGTGIGCKVVQQPAQCEVKCGHISSANWEALLVLYYLANEIPI